MNTCCRGDISFRTTLSGTSDSARKTKPIIYSELKYVSPKLFIEHMMQSRNKHNFTILKIQYAKTLIVFETHLQEDSCHQVRAYSPTGFPTNSTAQRLRRMSAVCATLTRPRAACVSVVAAAARACLRARQSSAR